ncbi:MAG: radical SAM protein, partial [Betaproteobacteria bacterium]
MTAAAFKVLSLIPPMTQLNTPYPSTAYLTGFLRSRGVVAVQDDLALRLVLRLFTRAGLQRLQDAARASIQKAESASLRHFLDLFERYAATIEPTVAFLQGRDPTLAHRINARSYLPEGPRFATLDAGAHAHGAPGDLDDGAEADPLGWAFGAMGLHDRARHL